MSPERARTIVESPLLTVPSVFTSERKLAVDVSCPERLRVSAAGKRDERPIRRTNGFDRKGERPPADSEGNFESTVSESATALAEQHRPIDIHYAAKFGISNSPLARRSRTIHANSLRSVEAARVPPS